VALVATSAQAPPPAASAGVNIVPSYDMGFVHTPDGTIISVYAHGPIWSSAQYGVDGGDDGDDDEDDDPAAHDDRNASPGPRGRTSTRRVSHRCAGCCSNGSMRRCRRTKTSEFDGAHYCWQHMRMMQAQEAPAAPELQAAPARTDEAQTEAEVDAVQEAEADAAVEAPASDDAEAPALDVPPLVAPASVKSAPPRCAGVCKVGGAGACRRTPVHTVDGVAYCWQHRKAVCRVESQCDDCCVCLDPLSTPCKNGVVSLACGHPIHHACLAKWALRSYNCPMCRRPMGAADVAKLQRPRFRSLAKEVSRLSWHDASDFWREVRRYMQLVS
jgi:hypothetical protein